MKSKERKSELKLIEERNETAEALLELVMVEMSRSFSTMTEMSQSDLTEFKDLQLQMRCMGMLEYILSTSTLILLCPTSKFHVHRVQCSGDKTTQIYPHALKS